VAFRLVGAAAKCAPVDGKRGEEDEFRIWGCLHGDTGYRSEEVETMSTAMHVVGVQVKHPANQTILLLRETEGERYLPIWIGAVEAGAISLEQEGLRPTRPLTHDLLKNVIGGFGRALELVVITDLVEGTFFAELVFDGGVRVSARPSDSVALALRVGVPIHADESVLEKAAMIIPDGQVAPDEQDGDVEKFREFLDSVSPEDFRDTDH
jgi:bifunctional DNase/RNase